MCVVQYLLTLPLFTAIRMGRYFSMFKGVFSLLLSLEETSSSQVFSGQDTVPEVIVKNTSYKQKTQVICPHQVLPRMHS